MRRTLLLVIIAIASILPGPILNLTKVYAAPYVLSASTVNVAIPAGSSSFVYITATSSTFSGILPLTTSISGPGITASLAPASVTLSAGGSAISKLSFSLPVGTASGDITVIADSSIGLGQAVVDVYLTAGTPGPGIKIVCCFPSGDGKISVAAGQTYTSWAWLYSLNNFTGRVSLTLNIPFPTSITPSIENLSPGQIVEPNIAITPPARTPGGTYYGSLNGTSSSATGSFPLSIGVSAASGLNQGIVCLSPTTAGCPSSSNFSAAVGSSFTAYIVIQAANTLYAYDIWFRYPDSILNATSISTKGSVLQGATMQRECVNGQGSPSCSYYYANGLGVVDLYATGNSTTTPTNGLLFSVRFNVTGTGSGPLGFFCVPTPTSSPIPDCATIYGPNGVGVQNASFTTDNSGPVGGRTLPTNKLGIFMPYLGLAGLLLIATAVSAIYLTIKSKRTPKQLPRFEI